jgi:hypothetical protein
MILALGSPLLLSLVITCKNDVPAASLFVAGALLQISGARAGEWLFLGLAASAKFVYWPLIAVWSLLFLPRALSRAVRDPSRSPWNSLVLTARASAVPVFMIVTPSLIWWTREWLATGNPVYPFGSRFFPSLGWEEENRTALKQVLACLPLEGVPHWTRVPSALVAAMGRVHLPVLLLLPGLLLFTRTTGIRRAALACLVGQALILGLTGVERYFLPSTWLLALLLAREAGSREFLRLFPRVPAACWTNWALVAYALAVAFTLPEVRNARWRDIVQPYARVRANALTYYIDAERLIREAGPAGLAEGWLCQPLGPARLATVSWRPRTPRPPKVVSVGEWRSYGFPARILYNGIFAETPLVWSVARRARNVPETAKLVRQWGAKLVLINFLTVEWQEVKYTPFRWKKDPLRRWVDFCRSYLEHVGSSAGFDNFNGGFHLFRIRIHPFARPCPTVPFAPGTEAGFSPPRPGVYYTNAWEALPSYLAAFKIMPDVAYSWNLVGHLYTLVGDMPKAYRYLREFGETGLQDSMNLTDLAGAAVQTGNLDLAERIIARALVACPIFRPSLRLHRASLNVQRALLALGKGKNEEAIRRCDAGLAALAGIPPEADSLNAGSKFAARVYLLGIKGEALLGLGRRAEGMDLLGEAVRLGPGSPPVARWRVMLAATRFASPGRR